MGLFEQAVATYDYQADRAGVYFAEEKEPLAPVGHIITKAAITVILDKNGKFISAALPDKNDVKTIIPATEESSGRTSNIAPHPLCEQLDFLLPRSQKKWEAYCSALNQWRISEYGHPFLDAVYTYVKSGSIAEDLFQYGIPASEEKAKKLFVRWRVQGIEGQIPDCWKNLSLFAAFQNYYYFLQSDVKPVFCQISGCLEPPAKQHLKGVVSANGNAKLISSNDDKGFTYRGRFTNPEQALSIGYTASQKAHNALKWLVANQGISCGGRTFLCWRPQGKQLPHHSFILKDIQIDSLAVPSDYRDKLNATIQSFRKDLQLKGGEKAIIAVFDAATNGRLAVTYYKEMAVDEYLLRLRNWNDLCCWWYLKFGIQAPSLIQVVHCAYGNLRKEKGVLTWSVDDALMKQQLQNLLICRLDGGVFPANIYKSLIDRASYPQAFEPVKWREVVYTACCAIRMTKYQKEKDDCMMWELNRPDRSFQFGRLLAAMERVEEEYYYQTDKEPRQTNAIRRLSAFKQRPMTVYEQTNALLLTAYLPRIKTTSRVQYEKIKEEIIALICSLGEENLNTPLSANYLIGYDLQRKAYFTSNKSKQTEGKENGSIEE